MSAGHAQPAHRRVRRTTARWASATAAGSWSTRPPTPPLTAAVAPARIASSGPASLEGRVPKRYRGVSFDRPPVLGMPEPVVSAVRSYVRNIDARIWTKAAECGSSGDIGTGKTTLAMLVSKAALRGWRIGGDLLAAAAAQPDSQRDRDRGRHGGLPGAPDGCRPAAHRRPGSREHDATGYSSSSIRSSTPAMRTSALDRCTTNLEADELADRWPTDSL